MRYVLALILVFAACATVPADNGPRHTLEIENSYGQPIAVFVGNQSIAELDMHEARSFRIPQNAATMPLPVRICSQHALTTSRCIRPEGRMEPQRPDHLLRVLGTFSAILVY